jgi:Acetyltransferase (GNAT) family
MEQAVLLRLMDLNMWEMFREGCRVARGGEVLDTPHATLCSTPAGTAFHNCAMVRAPVSADEILAEVADFQTRRGRPFSVWTRAHADGALEHELRARGFRQFLAMPGMALLADPGTRCEPPGLAIRPAIDDAGRRAYLEVSAESYAVYGQPRQTAEDVFVALESVCGPTVQGFVGWVGDEPVAAAAVYVTHGVAGIGWVGTMTAHRGRRYAEAVTWAAVRHGLAHGACFANLQASPMGRGVYERMGFVTPTEYRVLIREA